MFAEIVIETEVTTEASDFCGRCHRCHSCHACGRR